MMQLFTDTHRLSGAFIANKLARLIDTIADQGTELLLDAGIIIPSRAVSCVLLVGDNKGASVADIARALNQPHQLATQRTQALIDLGVMERIDDPKDGRRKSLALTEKGQEQYARLLVRLEEIEGAFADLFEEINCDLGKTVDEAARALERKSILDRINASPDETKADIVEGVK